MEKKVMLFLFIAMAFASVALAQPHVVMGSLHNSGGGYPGAGCIEFEAWMTLRPGEILTQVSDGCGYIDTLWFVNIGSFTTPPEDGEELNIFFRNTCDSETLTISGNVTLPGAEEYWGPYYLIPEVREITVTNPNGGGHYYWDEIIHITWTTIGSVGNVKIEYSPDAGGSWLPVVLSTGNDGAYDWIAPHVTSSIVLFKISEVVTPSLFDVSDGYTTIDQTPDLQMDYPDGGEDLVIDDNAIVAWTTTGAVGTVELHLSRDNGGSWEFVQGGLAARGTYNWAITGPASVECLMRVREETDTTLNDISDAVFEISVPPVGDTIPPATVSDLAVEEVEPTRARLSWTSPGDDGDIGTATTYVMGYDVIDFVWPPSFFVAGMPAPLVAGSGQEVWMEGLLPETEYWAAMVTQDEIPNESGVSNMVNFTTPVAPDTTPPAAFEIDTLEAREVDWDQFTIYWEAPGDDGNTGTADNYEFRMATTAFVEADFDLQPEITDGVPVPEVAGSVQNLIVDGLTADTDYWIAGKAWDDEGNDGPVSNILHIHTYDWTDDIPPATIIDLTCGDLDATAIELVFTATGDDGYTGMVDIGYEIRYRPDVDFDPMDFIFMTVYDTLAPVPSGTEVRTYVNGLDSAREYFFTVRPLDSDGPNGDASPTAGCWTLGVINPIPDLVMDEDDPDTALPDLSTVFDPPSGLTYDVSSSETGIIATLVDSEYVNISLVGDYFGEGWVVISATDGEDVLIDSIYVTVNSVNDAPEFITYPEDTLILDGFPWNYLGIADDADGDVVYYELLVGPIGMNVDISGYCFWLPVGIEGAYSVQLMAYDAEDTTIQNFNVVVIKYTHPVFIPQNLEALDGFRGCIPLMWDAPPAVSTGLPVHLSYYTVYRSVYFDIGYEVIADSVMYNSCADNTVDPGALYFYKVQAVYDDPDFVSGFSNIDGGASLAGDLLYSSYITGETPVMDGNTNEALWFDAVRAELAADAQILLMNDLHTLYIGMDILMTLYDGYSFRFFFDDDYSRTWDDESSTEGYYEATYSVGSVPDVNFYPINADSIEPFRLSEGAIADFEPIAPGYFSLEMFVDMTVVEEFMALPADSIGVGFQILNDVGDTVFEWPLAADLCSADELGTLLLGAPGGVPQFTVSPPILSVELEEGWDTEETVTLYNHGDGTAVWYLEESADWLDMSDTWGTIPPGTHREITAYFEAGTLDVGLYLSTISFTTNDPIGPYYGLPVEFEITPEVPAHYLHVYPPEETVADPGDLISVPIYVGDTYTNEITHLDFTVVADPEFLSPLTVTRGAGLPEDWTLIIRNIASDRVLVRLQGVTPLAGPAALINIDYAVSEEVLEGRSCLIEVADLLINFGLDELPIPVEENGIFIVGDDIRYFWYGMLHYVNRSMVMQDSLRFGLLDAASDDYDRGIDVINIPPFWGFADAWFMSSDWRELGTDIRPTGQIVKWRAYFEEDGYITWDPHQMWEGLLINDWLDMTEDSIFEVNADGSVEITFDARPGEYDWEIELVRGWNMISTPIRMPSMTTSAIFPDAIGVYGWNSSIQEYNTVYSIQAGRGYWVLSFTDTSYIRNGDAIYNYDASLPVGWIMLGSPAHRTYLADQDITPSDAFMYGTFYYYETEGIPHYEATDEFVPGLGQWVFNLSPAVARITSIYLPKVAPDCAPEPVASGRVYFADDPGVFVDFAMVEDAFDKPMPPRIPGASDRIVLDGDMPLMSGEMIPAKYGEWSGIIEITKSRRVEWDVDGRALFTIDIDGQSYRMDEASGIDLSMGAHVFKVAIDRNLPDRVTLYPNMPNPFNAATEIKFFLPAECEVDLDIYDVTGRAVRTLIDDKGEAGFHRVVWNGRSNDMRELPSGVYFAVLKTDAASVNQKLLLVK